MCTVCDCSFVECANIVWIFTRVSVYMFRTPQNVIIIIVYRKIDDQPTHNKMKINKQKKNEEKKIIIIKTGLEG